MYANFLSPHGQLRTNALSILLFPDSNHHTHTLTNTHKNHFLGEYTGLSVCIFIPVSMIQNELFFVFLTKPRHFTE